MILYSIKNAGKLQIYYFRVSCLRRKFIFLTIFELLDAALLYSQSFQQYFHKITCAPLLVSALDYVYANSLCFSPLKVRTPDLVSLNR